MFTRAAIDLKDLNSCIRTVPELIEHNATENGEHVFCIQCTKKDQDGSLQFTSISHLQLKQAILRCSAWLKENVPELVLPQKSDEGVFVKGPPAALLVESDVGLFVLKLSLISLGVSVVLLSARLSPTAIHHLLANTAATCIIASPKLRNAALGALDLFPQGQQRPALHAQPQYKAYLSHQVGSASLEGSICAPGYYIGENDCQVLILHSSGSTGLPKPIYLSHRQLLSATTCHDFASDEEAQGLCLSPSPLYHVSQVYNPALRFSRLTVLL